jgi:hypothetical protein
MIYHVPDQVADAVEAAAREGRAIQGAWRRSRTGGKELVGALAAFGPAINQPSDCPPDYMPAWLAELIPALGDGIAAERVPELFRGLASGARRWRVLSDGAWERVRCAFLCGCVTQALRAAAFVQPMPSPSYWEEVQHVCAAVCAALNGDGDLADARADAWTFAASEGALAFAPPTISPDAIWAAKSAAEAAWAAGAEAVSAARVAAKATAGVVWEPAARAAAYWELARRLFSLLNTEIATANGWRPSLRP